MILDSNVTPLTISCLTLGCIQNVNTFFADKLILVELNKINVSGKINIPSTPKISEITNGAIKSDRRVWV